MLDSNEGGRVLLGLGDSISLSLWPYALERVDFLFKKPSYWYTEPDPEDRHRTANVVFQLLQDPALMQRRFIDLAFNEEEAYTADSSHETK